MGGASVILQGDPNLSTSSISLKALWEALRQQGEGVLVELSSIGVVANEPKLQIPLSIQKVIDQFQSAFALTVGLPPPKSHDHAIVLHPGTSPINVRPCCYPQVRKAEIERLVREILEAGIV